MRLGDLLEWLAGAAFVAAAYLATRTAWTAVLVAGAFLAYQAQCWSSHPVKLPRVKLPRWVRLPWRKADDS